MEDFNIKDSDIKDFNIIETPAAESPKTPKGRKFLIAIAFLLLGGTTLGIGIGVGYYLARNFSQEAEVISPATDSNITSVSIGPLSTPIDPTYPDIADIIPTVKDSVVSISVLAGVNRPFNRTAPGSGSGFIFYKDDDYVYIATNNHVIENANQITISLDDNENVPAHVVGTYVHSDLAVLAVSREYLAEKGVPFAVATLGDSDTMRMGDTVLAIGNAMGGGQTVTKGIISATDLTITIDDPGMRTRLTLDVLQTDAAVNRGNSGGPLLNHRGEVIGIVTAKLMGSHIEGMGYAIPINAAREILQDLQETGSVRQPFIGITHDRFTEFMRDLFNIPYTGVLILYVVPHSPAQAAGLMVDDIIIYFNDVRTYDQVALITALQATRPGDTVPVVVFRDGQHVNMNLTLGTFQP